MLALLATSTEALHIPLAMLLVFGSAKLLAELFERFNQPGIVGEILAGVLIGPSVLGWVQPDQLLTALAELGVMFLLFQVGLHVKPSELFQVGGTALVVAIAGVAVPFLAGWGILLAWGEPQIEAIFTGAAMVATSVGITAQVLAANGWLNQRSAKIILAAAVIDDVLGLLVLAVVSNLAKGSVNVAGLAVTAVLAVLFVLFIAKFGSAAAARVVPKARRNLRLQEAEFSMALVLLFALAVFAVYTGVATIIGAFLAGLALSESISTRVRDLSHGATELLVPFFLAGIGLHLDLSALRNPSTATLALVILIAACLSKVLGCGLASLRLGRGEAFRIGVGMMPRGEVGMVVAQIGLSMGIISQGIYGVVVLMAVATTVIAPPLLKIAYRGVQPAGEVEEESFRIG